MVEQDQMITMTEEKQSETEKEILNLRDLKGQEWIMQSQLISIPSLFNADNVLVDCACTFDGHVSIESRDRNTKRIEAMEISNSDNLLVMEYCSTCLYILKSYVVDGRLYRGD